MTAESTGGNHEIFDADQHVQEIRKSYYHSFDDESVDKLKRYFKVEEDHEVFLRYLKNRKIPKTTPDDV